MEANGSSTLGELIAAQASVRPDAVAIAATDGPSLTYAGLVEQVERTRSHLQAGGLGRDDRVALMLGNGPELAAAFLSLSATLPCAPLNPAYREHELEFYLGDLGVAAVVVEAGAHDALRVVAARLGIRIFDLEAAGEACGRFALTPLAGADPGRAELPDPSTIALLLHTSGTTSRPKLVPLSHANLVASARNVARSLALTEDDRCLNVMPLFHIHGLVAGVLAPITAGGATICTSGLDPAAFFGWLEELRPTWYTAVPTMHQAVLARAATRTDAVPSSLRLIRSSSAALPRQVLAGLEEALGCPVIEAYGMTEASHQMATNPLPPGLRKPGSVGLASGVEIAILDEAGSHLPNGAVGEVAIRGPGVFTAYEQNPDANATAFAGEWFRTGDLGVLDSGGYLTLQGRSKEIINRGGEKISPLEVEDILLDHPAIAQAVVFSQPHPTLGETVAAAIVLEDGATTTERAVKEFAAVRLADFKVPGKVVLLDELPKGPTGKVQRIGLAERLELDGPRQADGSPPATPKTQLERELVALWQDLFNVETVGVHDDFFDLGGDSLVAALVFGWAVEHGYAPEDIPASTLLSAPTIAEFSDLLERKAWQAPEGMVRVKRGDEEAPLFCVAGHHGEIFNFGPLGNRLLCDRSCYVLVVRAEGELPAEVSIQGLAEEYLGTIRKAQPEGPYYLFGRCMGAGVVLEIARLLRADGQSVAFLGLLDPIGEHPGKLQHYWRRSRGYRTQGKLGRALLTFVETRLRRLRGPIPDSNPPTPLALVMLDASNAYVPVSYPGPAFVFRTVGYTTPASFWRKLLTGGVSVCEPIVETPSEHYDLLAAQLDRALAMRAGVPSPVR